MESNIKQGPSDEEDQWSDWADEETEIILSTLEGPSTSTRESDDDKITQPNDSDKEMYIAVPLGFASTSSTDETAPGLNKYSSPSSSDSENIPLAKLQKDSITQRISLRKLPVKRKLIQDDSCDEMHADAMSDDSVKDATYKPSEESASSSEHGELRDVTVENDAITSPIIKKRKVYKKRIVKDKAWKKIKGRVTVHAKKSCCKQNRNRDLLDKIRKKIKSLSCKRQTNDLSPGNNIKRVMKASKRSYSLKQTINNLHKNRIDQLLASNELKRVPVNADGNCFFAAVAHGIRDDTISDIGMFRSSLCDYMLENVDKYCVFTSTDSNDSTPREEFTKDIEVLRTSGEWNTNIADCLPLATADKFNCTLRIYSSSIATPVVDVKPSSSSESPVNVINIAYLAIRNEEHYEGAIKVLKKVTEHNIRKDNGPTNTSASAVDVTVQGERQANVDTNITPHKRADYQSPKKKISSRKKKRNVAEWKSNIRKKARSAGTSYVSRSGKTISSRGVKPHNCYKCKFKCSEKFSADERQSIFEMYYSLDTYERQRSFICDMISKDTTVRTTSRRKTKSLKYHLASGDRKERVCKDFFLKTLDIGRKTVSYTIDRKIHGTFSGHDRRGRRIPGSKISDERLNGVRSHIKSFPRMESHYSRKNTAKQYLANDLNIKRMWLLYCEECEKKGVHHVKQSKYRHIFCNEFNLSFFKPKKDQCSTCAHYNRHQEAGSLTEAMQMNYTEHQARKVEAREEKETDKSKAKNDEKTYVATFDMQAVLTTPCSLVSELYYSRKLCCYNLTVYSLGDKNVACHLWDETQGKRGSCEIATCLMKNTLTVCSSSPIENVTYFSDTCGGQNRNKFVAVSFMYTMSKLPRLKTLNHKFLQSGHSQMECDSVHSTIECAKKKTSIYVPSQWSTLVVLARKLNPYVAIPMKYDHVIDFKMFVRKHGLNFQKTTSGSKVNWLHVRWIQLRQDAPKTIFVNYTFDETQFLEVSVQHTGLRKRGRHIDWPTTDADLDKCYNSKLPISSQKKKDLVNLCVKSIIPEEFHGYFSSLKTSDKVRDKIPISTSDEESESD